VAASLDLVLFALRPQRAYAAAQGCGYFLDQPVELIRFAAQADQQHTAGIGVAGQSGEQRAGAIQVFAELRAAVRVAECEDAIDRLAVTGVGDGGDPLGGAGDAADRGQNPDFVARADAAVGPTIALEARDLVLGKGRGGHGHVGIAFDAGQQGLQIVAVDMSTGRDVLRQPPDRPAIFAHDPAGFEIAQGLLVAQRHVVRRLQRHRDVVVGAQPQQGGRFGRDRGDAGL